MTDKLTDVQAREVMEDILIDQRNGENKLRRLFLEHCDDIARLWAELPDRTPYERTSGTVFSILASIDGTSPTIPAFDMISATHKMVGNVLIEEGTLITGTRDLHGEYVQLQKTRMAAADEQVSNEEGEE